MKYLKVYNLFESIDNRVYDSVDDILLSIGDDPGFSTIIQSNHMSALSSLTKFKSFSWDDVYGTEINNYNDYDLDVIIVKVISEVSNNGDNRLPTEVSDSIRRLRDYMISEGYKVMFELGSDTPYFDSSVDTEFLEMEELEEELDNLSMTKGEYIKLIFTIKPNKVS